MPSVALPNEHPTVVPLNWPPRRVCAGPQASALSKLRLQGYEVATRGCALLGYVAAGGTAGVLLATRVRKKCTLPGGHAVFLVVDSQWVLIPLQVSRARGGCKGGDGAP